MSAIRRNRRNRARARAATRVIAWGSPGWFPFAPGLYLRLAMGASQ